MGPLTDGPPVLPDTSVWVTYLRRGAGASPPLLREALGGRRVLTCGPVVAELLQGRDEEGRLLLEERFAGLPWAPIGRDDWLLAGHLAGELARRGTRPSLSDVLIAVAARRAGAILLTADADHRRVADLLGDLHLEEA